MQMSAMKACFQIAECNLSSAKIQYFFEFANVYVCFLGNLEIIFLKKH